MESKYVTSFFLFLSFFLTPSQPGGYISAIADGEAASVSEHWMADAVNLEPDRLITRTVSDGELDFSTVEWFMLFFWSVYTESQASFWRVLYLTKKHWMTDAVLWSV